MKKCISLTRNVINTKKGISAFFVVVACCCYQTHFDATVLGFWESEPIMKQPCKDMQANWNPTTKICPKSQQQVNLAMLKAAPFLWDLHCLIQFSCKGCLFVIHSVLCTDLKENWSKMHAFNLKKHVNMSQQCLVFTKTLLTSEYIKLSLRKLALHVK